MKLLTTRTLAASRHIVLVSTIVVVAGNVLVVLGDVLRQIGAVAEKSPAEALVEATGDDG